MKYPSVNLFVGTLIAVGACIAVQPHANAQDEQFAPPLGLPPLPVPADNPMTMEKVELGKMLYFDKRLSKDKSLSCATCHDPKHAYAEPRATSEGIDGQLGDMNSPTVINSAYMTTMFWDGRMGSLEEQAAGPMENPIEMGHQIPDIAKELNSIPEYKERFESVFGESASQETMTKAIAAFERTVLSGNSPYDQYKNGDEDALDDIEKKGMNLFFGKALCSTCHTAPLFTNGNFVNTGIGHQGEGRMAVTGVPGDKGAYRVPTLREAEHTGPYFHDGSVNTLKEAVKIMADGGVDNPNRHAILKVMPKLSDDEIDQLVAFIHALSGDYPIYEEPEMP